MTRRGVRWSVRLGVAALAVVVTATASIAGAAWGPPAGAAGEVVGPTETWNNGTPSIVATANGTLVAVYITDYWSDGKFTFDGTGRYLSAYAIRSTDDGATWSAPFRLNGAYHAERASLAVSGNRVCSFFMRQQKYYARGFVYTFTPSARRLVYARCSADAGATWGAITLLPGQTDTSRGDYLGAAAGGTNFYVTTTASDTGDVVVWVSNNNGGTWSKTTVGSTNFEDKGAASYVGGFSALPAAAAVGSNVGIEWVSAKANQGVMTARISTNAGAAFGTPLVLATKGAAANLGFAQAAGADHRLAFTWTTPTAGFLRIYDTTAAAWQPRRRFVSFPDADPAVGSVLNKGGNGAIPLLKPGTNVVGIAMAECNRTPAGTMCDWTDGDDREQLVYRQSGDNGATWGAVSIVAKPVTNDKGTNQNNFGWGLFHGGAPYVFWNAHNAAYTAYTNKLKVCTGC